MDGKRKCDKYEQNNKHFEGNKKIIDKRMSHNSNAVHEEQTLMYS